MRRLAAISFLAIPFAGIPMVGHTEDPEAIGPTLWYCTDSKGFVSVTKEEHETVDKRCSVAAAEWMPLTQGDKAVLYYNVRTLARDEKHVKMWFLWDYKADQQTLQYPPKTYRSTKALNYFKCSERTSAVAQQAFYLGEKGGGEYVTATSMKRDSLQFEDVVPGTMGEAMLDLVCAMADVQWPKAKPNKSAPKKK